MKLSLLFVSVSVLVLGAGSVRADVALAERGHSVLKKYCYRCHGTEFKVPMLNVLDRERLTAPRDGKPTPYVTPGDPTKSPLWKRVMSTEDAMPPEDAPERPSDAERQTLKEWILDGFTFPERKAPEPVNLVQVLSAIETHLRASPETDRRYKRFFTLHHLYNNPTFVEADLNLYRAALSKAANSLSWEPEIVRPAALSETRETVFAVDLRDFGWDKRRVWRELLKEYPYGLTLNEHKDATVRDLYGKIVELSGSDLPFVRADWFVAAATRPPLYHTLLDLPKKASELEKKLHVDTMSNFLRDRVDRAGFAASGVSKQNRVVDRHAAAYGAYWKSYDFKSGGGERNVFHYPLGPEFSDNPFARQAFKHDGGEIIFHLPNGLLGYLLVDDADERIDVGPIGIVNDPLCTSGTPEIVNGLSCMACHRHGAQPLRDDVRSGLAVFGAAQEKALRLFKTPDEMNPKIAKDQARFMAALDEAAGKFLKCGADAEKNLEAFPEPCGAIARLYLKDLGSAEVACELGLDRGADLKAMVSNYPDLRRMGLGPLADGATIKREAWISPAATSTRMFQDAALKLQLGTPHQEL